MSALGVELQWRMYLLGECTFRGDVTSIGCTWHTHPPGRGMGPGNKRYLPCWLLHMTITSWSLQGRVPITKLNLRIPVVTSLSNKRYLPCWFLHMTITSGSLQGRVLLIILNLRIQWWHLSQIKHIYLIDSSTWPSHLGLCRVGFYSQY